MPLAAIFSAKGPQTSPSAWLRRASDAYLQVVPGRRHRLRGAVTAGGSLDAAGRSRGRLPVDRSGDLEGQHSRLEPVVVQSQSAALRGRGAGDLRPRPGAKVTQRRPRSAHRRPLQGERRVPRMFGELLDYFDVAPEEPLGRFSRVAPPPPRPHAVHEGALRAGTRGARSWARRAWRGRRGCRR